MYSTIYMIVTNDKYRLPLYWGESTAELAKNSGLNYFSVRRGVIAAMRGTKRRTKYEVVRVEDDE